MALDAATVALMERMAAQGRPPLHLLEPAKARAAGSMLTALIGPGPEMARVEDIALDTADGMTFTIRVLAPKPDPVGVVVYLHGGGWMLGDIEQFDTLGRQLAMRTGCAVIMVDYRKAPEHPYPKAVEDAWLALNWAADNLRGPSGESLPLVVAGDSSGGNLAAVVALRARDRRGPVLSLQVLIYPVTDADLDTASYLDPQNQLIVDRESMVWFWGHYVDVGRRGDPEVSPLRAVSFSGLPPTILLIAEYDVLRSGAEAYGDALAAAGVPVDMRLFAGQTHGFFSMVNILPGSNLGIDYVAAAVRERLSALGSLSRPEPA